MLRAMLSAASLTAGGLVGWILPANVPPGAPLQSETTVGEVICAGGMETQIDVDIVPVAVYIGEGIDIDVVLLSTLTSEGLAKWSLEVVNDRGVYVTLPTTSDAAVLRPQEENVYRRHIPLPVDGFYEVRVTAAVVATDEQADEITSRYFQVSVGDVSEISFEEYMKRSLADVPVRVPAQEVAQ